MIDILVRLLVDSFSKRSAAFWRKWAAQFEAHRQELIAASRSRDEERAVKAMRAYLGGHQERIAAESTLSEAKLSDREVLRIIHADAEMAS
ncbi:hypothetical protein F8568_023290 [Actinomadura sp. LD22]|uniref:FCD domain-containing protein n=1 Tax=Actinomadura physcomitrii TaxID=2650748 RepID=A0A6I4MAH7_9ACTN|nr:hypothetical protein [Actinomadura physcomitrii]MWA03248.1 hypothetical protein [Actinomadura physcomitrii]